MLLIVADTSTLRGARALEADVLRVSAADQDAHALLIVGVVALIVALWAALANSRLAWLVLVAAGVASAIVVAAVDLPSLGSTSSVSQLFTSVRAWDGSAIYPAAVGAVLLLVTGVAGLVYRGGSTERTTRVSR